MGEKIGCKVFLDGTWRRGTLEWLTPQDPAITGFPLFTEESDENYFMHDANRREAPSPAVTSWTSSSPQFSPQEFTTSNEIKWESSKGVDSGELMKNGIKIEPSEMINAAPPKEDSLTPKQGARLKAAAFYQRLYFWGLMIGFVGGGWLAPYLKSAVWHLGQFLVSLK